MSLRDWVFRASAYPARAGYQRCLHDEECSLSDSCTPPGQPLSSVKLQAVTKLPNRRHRVALAFAPSNNNTARLQVTASTPLPQSAMIHTPNAQSAATGTNDEEALPRSMIASTANSITPARLPRRIRKVLSSASIGKAAKPSSGSSALIDCHTSTSSHKRKLCLQGNPTCRNKQGGDPSHLHTLTAAEPTL